MQNKIDRGKRYWFYLISESIGATRLAKEFAFLLTFNIVGHSQYNSDYQAYSGRK